MGFPGGAVHAQLAAVVGILLYLRPGSHTIPDAEGRRAAGGLDEPFRLRLWRSHAVFPGHARISGLLRANLSAEVGSPEDSGMA